jgi:hypothetical protein
VNREIRPILAIGAVVTILVLVVIALRPGTTETVVLPRVDLPPPGTVGSDGGPIALVTGLHEDQESSFFGLVRGEKHHIVSVQFYAPPECIETVTQGEEWPVVATECSVEVPIHGVVSGSGIAPTGETIILVDTEVSEDCYSTISPGDPWPPAADSCL